MHKFKTIDCWFDDLERNLEDLHKEMHSKGWNVHILSSYYETIPAGQRCTNRVRAYILIQLDPIQ